VKQPLAHWPGLLQVWKHPPWTQRRLVGQPQVPPQPSLSPAHLPAQVGAQVVVVVVVVGAGVVVVVVVVVVEAGVVVVVVVVEAGVVVVVVVVGAGVVVGTRVVVVGATGTPQSVKQPPSLQACPAGQPVSEGHWVPEKPLVQTLPWSVEAMQEHPGGQAGQHLCTTQVPLQQSALPPHGALAGPHGAAVVVVVVVVGAGVVVVVVVGAPQGARQC
jgi:hypothetical protein